MSEPKRMFTSSHLIELEKLAREAEPFWRPPADRGSTAVRRSKRPAGAFIAAFDPRTALALLRLLGAQSEPRCDADPEHKDLLAALSEARMERDIAYARGRADERVSVVAWGRSFTGMGDEWRAAFDGVNDGRHLPGGADE